MEGKNIFDDANELAKLRECNRQLQAENDRLKKLCVDLEFAYRNKDGEAPHQFETEALNDFENFKEKTNE